MKKNIIVSAILAICLCTSLIAGATFAIFTSESKVNIAITSGKVDVVATMGDLELYSPTALAMDGTIVNANNAVTEDGFANGGEATLAGNELTLIDITPGDKVSFNINLVNNSNVNAKYRYGYTIEALNGDLNEAKKLYTALKLSVSNIFENKDIETSRFAAYKTGWAVAEVGSKDVPVSVEMLGNMGNEYQNLSAKIVFTVEAVQGNTQVALGEEFEYLFADQAGFSAALNDLNTNTEVNSATLSLVDSFSFDDQGIKIEADKDVTIDINGKTLTINNTVSDGIIVNTGSTLSLNNTKDSGKYIFNCTSKSSDGIYVLNEDEDQTATLNITGDVEINTTALVNTAIHAYASKGKAVINVDGATVKVNGKEQTKAIVVDQNSTLNLNNTKFELSCDFDSYSDGNDVVGILLWGQNGKQENITVNIGDGTEIKVGGKNAFAQGIQIGMKNGYSENLNIYMTGGEIILNPTENGEGYAFTAYKGSYGKFQVSGGKVSGTITALSLANIGEVDITISGGTFGIDPSDHLAAGYKATEDSGVWTVEAE